VSRAPQTERQRIYQALNRDRINAQRRARWRRDSTFRAKHIQEGKDRRVKQRAADPVAYKVRQYWRMIWTCYRLTREAWCDLFEAQDGACGLCAKQFVLVIPPTGLQVDHCHRTGRVRGLLCHSCNTKLGWYEKRAALIREYVGW